MIDKGRYRSIRQRAGRSQYVARGDVLFLVSERAFERLVDEALVRHVRLRRGFRRRTD
jgi:hypothetical protein